MSKPFIYTSMNMQAPDSHPVGPGTGYVFSMKSPAKERDNEDAALLYSCAELEGVLAVADGMGGLPAGAQASRFAVEELGKLTSEYCDAGHHAREAIISGFENANQAIINSGAGSATTMIAVEIDDHTIRPYNVGDSQMLLVGQRGKLKALTVAHSPVGYAVEAGVLNEEDALFHKERHLVSNYLGTSEMRIEIGAPIRMAARDTLLLATDGIFDNFNISEITEIIRKGPLEKACTTLIERCYYRMETFEPGTPGKADDMTLILYRLEG